ncbi:MAG TPA: hypothetical protein QF764_10650 [Planctomycetota bacterium]|nr:hypothetical protein [Planctomycetota bacterium]
MIGLALRGVANASANAGETGMRETLRFLDLPEAWVGVLIILPLTAGVAWIGYRREHLQPWARWTLVSLRFVALAILLGVLFRPVFVQRTEEVKPAEVIVLIDDSASMRRMDAYAGDDAAREALAHLAPRALGATTRLELAAAGIEGDLLPLLAEGAYEPRLFRFDEDTAPLPDLTGLTGRGRGTSLGDALSGSLAAHRGRHVTDVVIVSDGRSNGGSSPLDAARAAAASGIAVHTIVVGDTRPERNVLVQLVEIPEEVLEGDEIAVTARVIGRGSTDLGTVSVILEELDRSGAAARLLAEESARPDESGERVVFLAPPGAPERGRRERRFRISVAPVRDETLLDDNAVEFSIQIAPEKIRVLYIDGYPRWEYRFLKELLKRSDENISAQMFLLSATADFPQESTRGLPSLLRIPTDRKQLLADYDVIILGDVNLYDVSADPARCEEFMASLLEFVERGGGLMMQAGELDDPRSYVDTELEQLLPVVLDARGAIPFDGDTTVEFRPTLEDPGAPHQIVRLHADDETNRALWESEGGLRGFNWYWPVARAKPGSQVLLRHPVAEGPYGRHPLLVAGYFPAGRTLFLAIDATWMWRYRFGDRYHERFWRNAIRWLALGRLKSGNRRVSLDSLRSTYALDERVVLEARVLDEDFRPSDRDVQEAALVGPDGRREELTLLRVAGRDGLFRTSLEVDRPGSYQAWIEIGEERVTSTEFEVVLPSRENIDPSPDPAGMAALAAMTGGESVSMGNIDRLTVAFPGGEERREALSSSLKDAWDHWGTLLAALAVLSAEWILRKRLELV